MFCCVVLDAFSRKVVGWAIDSTQTTALVTSALGMATKTRNPASGWYYIAIAASNLGSTGRRNSVLCKGLYRCGRRHLMAC